MASPYFTPVRVRPINTSGMAEAGQAVGNMYANLGKQVGNAIGQVGSAYFENKKLERTMMDHIKTEEGVNFLREKGYSDEEISNLMKGGDKSIRNEVKKIYRDAGGVDAVRDKLRDTMEFNLRVENSRTQNKTSQINLEASNLALEQALRKNDEYEMEKNAMGHFFRKGPDGSPAMDLKGFKITPQNAPVIQKLSKEYNIPGFSTPNFASVFGSMDFDPTDKASILDVVNGYNARAGDGIDQANKRKEYAMDQYVDPKDISESVKRNVEADPTWKKSSEALGTFEGIKATLDEAFIIGEDGTYRLGNPISVKNFRRQVAKAGSGVGVMTDADVEDYSGATDWKSTFDRISQKYGLFGSDEDSVSTPLSQDDIRFLDQHFRAIHRFHSEKVEKGVREALKTSNSNFQNVQMRKIIEHSGYAQFLSFDKDGQTRMSEDNMMEELGTITNNRGNEYTSSESINAIQRAYEDGVTDADLISMFSEANPNMPEDKIVALIEYARRQIKFRTDMANAKEAQP